MAARSGVLIGNFFDPPPPAEQLARELEGVLAGIAEHEALLDASRRWANDRRFQVGVQSLRGILEIEHETAALSDIAEVAVRGLYPHVLDQFAKRHGRIADCGMAIIAMGKLGGREMTATSDLDLIFVYDTPQESDLSDGPVPLSATQYFARLSQRLINAISAPTSEGVLCEVDMRLRPSGKAGPIAVSFDSFDRYQRTQAWTWERMALTRARVIDGPPKLVANVEHVVRDVLMAPRDPDALVVDVSDMRTRMEAEHHTDSIWEVKHVRGGLVDVEFIAQYLQLRDGHAHPDILSTNTAGALKAIRDAGLLADAVADDLLAALRLWQAVQGRIRLSWHGPVSAVGADDAPRALQQVMDGLLGLDFRRLAERMADTAKQVRDHFDTIIDGPAAAVRARVSGSTETD